MSKKIIPAHLTITTALVVITVAFEDSARFVAGATCGVSEVTVAVGARIYTTKTQKLDEKSRALTICTILIIETQK